MRMLWWLALCTQAGERELFHSNLCCLPPKSMKVKMLLFFNKAGVRLPGGVTPHAGR